MRGTVYQLDSGSWRAQVDLPSPDGERSRESETFDTKTAAEKWLAKINSDLDKYGQLRDTEATLEEFLWEWYEQHAVPNTKETTHKRYKQLMENHIIPELGNLPLKDITPMMLGKFYRDREENGSLQGDGGLASSTVRKMHVILHRAFEDAVRWQRMKNNPASAVQAPKSSSREFTTLSASEAKQLVEVAEDVSAYGPLYHMAVSLGMRRGEILGLRWEDVDLENQTLKIVQTYSPAGNTHVFDTPKNDSSRRTLGLPEGLTFRLKRHRQHQNDQKDKVGPAWEDHDLVFASEIGSPIQNIGRDWQRVKDEAEIPDIRFHDLRHTCATLMLENGEHPKTVSHKLGHSSIKVTLDIYSHVSTDLQQKASQALEDEIFEDEDDDNLQATG